MPQHTETTSYSRACASRALSEALSAWGSRLTDLFSIGVVVVETYGILWGKSHWKSSKKNEKIEIFKFFISLRLTLDNNILGRRDTCIYPLEICWLPRSFRFFCIILFVALPTGEVIRWGTCRKSYEKHQKVGPKLSRFRSTLFWDARRPSNILKIWFCLLYTLLEFLEKSQVATHMPQHTVTTPYSRACASRTFSEALSAWGSRLTAFFAGVVDPWRRIDQF